MDKYEKKLIKKANNGTISTFAIYKACLMYGIKVKNKVLISSLLPS